ncbi:MAG: PASTA domain-containing protein [Nocardioides sp.]|uniref:PASTA domain-containing protein n=1 Tax=Nocardioides sp. TaxID=35761 RepID=UPI003F073ED4
MEPDERARTNTSGPAGNPTDPLVGRLLDGRYRIGDRIARGGMASVYRATDLRLDRTVAVKVMHPGLGDDDAFARRFVREARAAARLNHPHVVGVYDQGDEDGTVYLAMEYVPGQTLRDLVRAQAPLSPARALELFTPLVQALAAAHRAGVVHRDVKPENVLISDEADGHRSIKVADFGLAKAVSSETSHTATGGVLIGTVSYLAPELVVDGEADARVDVYAAGVVLFELLTGTKPHEGESPIQVAYKHVHTDIPLPSTLVAGIPDYVDALVARATSRDRSQRPADASVLLRHVDRVTQAIRSGALEDPELAEDLRPRPAPAVAADEGLSIFDDVVDPSDPDLPTVVAPAVAAASPSASSSASPASSAPESTAVAPFDPIELANAGRTTSATPTNHDGSRPRDGEDPATRHGLPPVGAAPQQARRRSARGPLLLALALLLVVGVGVGAWWFGWARYTTTPAVLNLTQKVAVERLEAAGLEARIGDPAFSETVKAGLVVSTDPGPNERVVKDGVVTLRISQGPERYDVPQLRGMSEDEAQDLLRATNLAFGTSSQQWHDSIPEGQVITSSPEAGTTLKPGAKVNLVISKGRKPITITDWTGKDFETAKKKLEAQGLVVRTVGEEFSDDVDDGDVISQTPTSGTLYKGDTVEFVVSKGPELIEVPQVRASGADAAEKTLTDAGFKVRVEHDDNYLGLGFVMRTDPSAGTMVPKGSTITIYLI